MSTADTLSRPARTRPSWARRACAATGGAFVVLTFAGNALTESVVDPTAEISGQQALEDFAAKASSPVAQVGLMMELLGFMALIVFGSFIADTLRKRGTQTMTGAVVVISVTTMLAVKLGSGAPYLAGLTYHSLLTPETALALALTNGTAFVICWLPFALFVLASAWGLRAAGLIGRLGVGAGLLIGGLGVVGTLVAAIDTSSAVPVPFLLGCLWTAAVSAKLALTARS